ncbi:MAG: GTPase Era [Endozoicomonadaceae bacterium]|nr:GTPase Era [Endozoicomonadaceae bacterium]
MTNHHLNKTTQQCGYIAVVGRPNVGKSTLINHLIGQKINITSRKPQTTQRQLLSIKTNDNTQMIFVDTPGLHTKTRYHNSLSHAMKKEVKAALSHADVVLCLFDRLQWTASDALVLQQLQYCEKPIILAVNKIDRITDKQSLIPWLQTLSNKLPAAHLIPISALKADNLDHLLKLITQSLPSNPYLFDEDQVTDSSMRFLAAEIIREKIIRQMGDEIPYEIAIEIEQWEDTKNITYIDALIIVSRPSQKKMMIGSHGTRLKQIGIDARKDLEQLINQRVMLKLWVKPSYTLMQKKILNFT